ncbi:MAG TPA: GNAT family protein [Pyrinomonadaceae bacterium]
MTDVGLRKPVVVGTKIYLRFPELGDLKEFIALNLASKRLHRGLASPPTRPEQFRALVKKCRQDDFVGFFVCRVDDGTIVGSINLSQIFRGGFQNAYLGYHVGAEHARRGYMSEAIELVLKYAFENLRLHRVEANIQPRNLASIAVVKLAGFVCEGYSRRYLKVCGRWRDHERWAILAEDWRAKRRKRNK